MGYVPRRRCRRGEVPVYEGNWLPIAEEGVPRGEVVVADNASRSTIALVVPLDAGRKREPGNYVVIVAEQTTHFCQHSIRRHLRACAARHLTG
jgi:hypothetical protein